MKNQKPAEKSVRKQLSTNGKKLRERVAMLNKAMRKGDEGEAMFWFAKVRRRLKAIEKMAAVAQFEPEHPDIARSQFATNKEIAEKARREVATIRESLAPLEAVFGGVAWDYGFASDDYELFKKGGERNRFRNDIFNR